MKKALKALSLLGQVYSNQLVYYPNLFKQKRYHHTEKNIVAGETNQNKGKIEISEKKKIYKDLFDSINSKIKNSKVITLWDKIHHPFLDEEGFKKLLINQQELHPGRSLEGSGSAIENFISPQAMQGRWQAYGQIRAARIAGRSVVLATGIFGVGLFIYKQVIKWQAKREQEEFERYKKDTTVLLKAKEDEVNAAIKTHSQQKIDLNLLAYLKLENEKSQAIIEQADNLFKQADSIVPETNKKGFYQQFSKFKAEKNEEYTEKMFDEKILNPFQENNEEKHKETTKPE